MPENKENNNARALVIGLFAFIGIGLAVCLMHKLNERREALEKSRQLDEEKIEWLDEKKGKHPDEYEDVRLNVE